MLKQLRQRKTAKRILWVLAIVIIPAFVFWGASSSIRDKKVGHAGKIFGKKISLQDYKDSYAAVRNQAILRYGDNFAKLEKYLGLNQQAWHRILLIIEANKRKIKIPDEEVISTIQTMPIFQENGKFSQKFYEYILHYVFRVSARAFEENLRDTFKISKLYDKITEKANINDKELEDKYRNENEQVKINYILISPQDYSTQEKIKQNEIKAYFEENKETFARPVSRNIQYAGINYPKEASDQDKIDNKNKLKALRDKINNYSDFERIIKEESLILEETGFFFQNQPIPQIGWSNEFSSAAFSLTEKSISQPIDTAKGIYILRLKEKKETYIPEIDEVNEEIKNILTKDKIKIIAREKSKSIFTKLTEKYQNNPKANFTKLAKGLGFEIKQTPLFKRDAYIEEIGISKEFSNIAFALDEGKISEVVETDKGFFILKLNQLVKIDKEKFEEEKEEFKDKLLIRKKQESFNLFLKDLKAKANLISYIPEN